MIRPASAVLVLAILHILPGCRSPRDNGPLRLTRAEYADRTTAIWNAQVVSVLLGWEFEHKVGSVEWVDEITLERSLRAIEQAGDAAPIDDDWYYEMANLGALERYGTGLTLEQLGQYWVEHDVGVWGASGQARAALLQGITPPLTGNPRYNNMWFSMGAQNRSELWGMLLPGRPQDAAELSRRYNAIMSYAEGLDGGAYVAALVSLAFVESDVQELVRRAVHVLHPDSPHRMAVESVIRMAEAGYDYRDIADATMDRWQIEYPATNNSVANAGIATVALWFGGGDFVRSLNIGFEAADYTDADCNATLPAVVLAAMHGMAVIPANLLAPLHDHMRGDRIGPVEIDPPVDGPISDLGARTATMGERMLVERGASIDGEVLLIPVQSDLQTPAESGWFDPDDFTQWWDSSWTMERAGFGAPGGGHRGIRGGTYVEDGGAVLVTFPRDEVRGVKLSRAVHLDSDPVLHLEVGADPGRTWKLEVYVQNDRLLSELVDGGPPLEWPGVPDTWFPPVADDMAASRARRAWKDVDLDLSAYADRDVTIRLYQHTLVRNAYPGNAYWQTAQLR